jgi:hypothetical protein
VVIRYSALGIKPRLRGLIPRFPGSQFATPGVDVISGRKSEFPRLVNTSEKPARTKISKRVFVLALHLRSQTKPN